MQESDLAGAIDHTLLRADATRPHIFGLCLEASRYGFHAVCINPCYVDFARHVIVSQSLGGVRICTVVGFPLGATSSESKVEEALRALEDGAQEIDMVINVGALKEGRFEYVSSEIARVAELLRSGMGLTLKVILEAPLLTDAEKIKACELAAEAGAHFVKTSTGFHPNGGVTLHDVRLLHKAVGGRLAIKAAGGIQDLRTALAMIRSGASRLGTSSSVRIMEELRSVRGKVPG